MNFAATYTFADRMMDSVSSLIHFFVFSYLNYVYIIFFVFIVVVFLFHFHWLPVRSVCCSNNTFLLSISFVDIGSEYL